MLGEYLKGWLAATKSNNREEAAAKNKHPTEERTTEGPNGTGVGDRRYQGRGHLWRRPTERGWWKSSRRSSGRGDWWRRTCDRLGS